MMRYLTTKQQLNLRKKNQSKKEQETQSIAKYLINFDLINYKTEYKTTTTTKNVGVAFFSKRWVYKRKFNLALIQFRNPTLKQAA